MMPDSYDRLIDDYRKTVIPSLIPNVSPDLLLGSFSNGRNQLLIQCGNDFANGTRYATKSSRFIHFTSLRALHSIINENALRLYSLKNVNDPNELSHFIGNLLPTERLQNIQANTYILSLCATGVLNEENILNLWRLYGNEGWGVAIEFDINFGGYTSDNGYFLGKVIYEKPNIADFLARNEEFENKHNIKMNISDLLRVPASFHKSAYYKVEEEVRLMYFDDASESKATYEQGEMNNYRWDFNSRNEIVTYRILKLGEESLHPLVTIKRVQIGFRHSENSFKRIKNHFIDIFTYKCRTAPIIEQSPLKDIYR